MSNRSVHMHEYRHIIVRLRLGESIRSIAKSGLASRGTVRFAYKIARREGWIDTQYELPSDEVLAPFFKKSLLSKTPSSVLPYKNKIEEWCQQHIQASTIYSALQRQYGFTGSYDSVQRFTKKVKDRLSIKTTTILEFSPGEAAQVDFGAGPRLVDSVTGEIIKTWIFVMVLCWSRHQYAEIILHQDVETWLGCHRRAFEWFNSVPRKIIIDNAKCAIIKACYHDPVVQRAYAEYAEGYGFLISACPPRDPQKKGRVESGVKYVKNNFVPLREFRDLVDANQQLKEWVLSTAGNRIHGSVREKPLTLFETERLLLKPLPEHPPECAVWAKVTCHSDCHVQFLQCRYSVPYQQIKQILWLRATESTVRIYHESSLVATHPRLWKAGTRHTLNEHLPPNAMAYCMRHPQWCLEQSKQIGQYCGEAIEKLLKHSVVDYLRAAQGIIGLEKKYGAARLDAACHRALVFQAVHYKSIKLILQKGLEYEPLPDQDAFDALTETYTGRGRFSRNTSTILQ